MDEMSLNRRVYELKVARQVKKIWQEAVIRAIERRVMKWEMLGESSRAERIGRKYGGEHLGTSHLNA